MAILEDRWFYNGNNHRPTPVRGQGMRWRVRYGGADRPYSRSFRYRRDAAEFFKSLEEAKCLVPGCRQYAATKPPALLCKRHASDVVTQLTTGRVRTPKHEPLVYFARNGSRVKIGWTTNLKGRMASLSIPQSSVVLTLPGGEEREAALHERFDACRVPGSEWFDSTPELEEFIACCVAETNLAPEEMPLLRAEDCPREF